MKTKNMTVKNLVLQIAVVSALSFVCLTNAFAQTGTVPLKGWFEGAGNDFSGNFTHLGSFTGVIDPGAFTAVWTAANGDRVTNQTLTFDIVDVISPNVFRYRQTIMITGGTGRFANATGNADIVGTIDFNTGEYDGYLSGKISRPNSQ